MRVHAYPSLEGLTFVHLDFEGQIRFDRIEVGSHDEGKPVCNIKLLGIV